MVILFASHFQLLQQCCNEQKIDFLIALLKSRMSFFDKLRKLSTLLQVRGARRDSSSMIVSISLPLSIKISPQKLLPNIRLCPLRRSHHSYIYKLGNPRAIRGIYMKVSQSFSLCFSLSHCVCPSVSVSLSHCVCLSITNTHFKQICGIFLIVIAFHIFCPQTSCMSLQCWKSLNKAKNSLTHRNFGDEVLMTSWK